MKTAAAYKTSAEDEHGMTRKQNGAALQEQKKNTRWKKGQSGNPAGRPKGSKDKFCKAFVDDLAHEWQKRGAQAMANLTDQELVRTGIAVLPKDLFLRGMGDGQTWVINASPMNVQDWVDAYAGHGVTIEAQPKRLQSTLPADQGEALPQQQKTD